MLPQKKRVQNLWMCNPKRFNSLCSVVDRKGQFSDNGQPGNGQRAQIALLPIWVITAHSTSSRG